MALILVIDDEADVRAALKALLEDDGHRVVEGADGAELIDLTLAHWPDLILLDHFMPRVTGLEALQGLRHDPAGAQFPVVMVTAAARPEDAQRARNLGVAEFIGKPWGEGEIEMRVKWILARAEKPRRIPTERILVVDDEEHVRLALTSLLEDAGYEAASAPGGEDAVQIAGSLAPDLLLMDLRMPGVDGLEATRRLRQNPATAKLPVIVVSAAQSRGEVTAAIALGAVDYIIKPWHPRDLEKRVRRALDAAALARGRPIRRGSAALR